MLEIRKMTPSPNNFQTRAWYYPCTQLSSFEGLFLLFNRFRRACSVNCLSGPWA